LIRNGPGCARPSANTPTAEFEVPKSTPKTAIGPAFPAKGDRVAQRNAGIKRRVLVKPDGFG
jgi:hypothetical protein